MVAPVREIWPVKPGQKRPPLLPPPGPPLPARNRISEAHSRTPPMPHREGRQTGCCTWCGHPILTEGGLLYTHRAMHLECTTDYLVATSGAQARVFVDERDRGVCASCGIVCGETLLGWRCHDAQCRAHIAAGNAWPNTPRIPGHDKPCWHAMQGEPGRQSSWGLYSSMRYRAESEPWCMVEPVFLSWHADHEMPLWMADRTDYPACLRFWSLANLQTLCEPCHQEKTTIETKLRAKMDRQASKFGAGAMQRRKDKTLPPF